MEEPLVLCLFSLFFVLVFKKKGGEKKICLEICKKKIKKKAG